MGKLLIKKANGKHVPFNPNKVEATCIRAGASKKFAHHISEQVLQKIHPGMSTRQVYNLVLQMLSQDNQGYVIGHRYRLKESIMLMGPMGFPFEVYVSEILENYGHQTNHIRKKFKGCCITHEIDIVTQIVPTKEQCLVECKYHSSSGIFTGLKESLYTHARFLDLTELVQHELLVCNTKISSDAVTYANCVGQHILCWRHPQQKGLERLIEDKGLYPVTMLRLNPNEVTAFAKSKIMVAKKLLDVDLSVLSKKTKIPHARLQKLQNTARQILR